MAVELPEPISFMVSALKFPCLMEPDVMDPRNRNLYGVSVPWQDIPESLVGIMEAKIESAQRNKWGVVSFRGIRKPRIYGQLSNLADLISFWDRVDAMNLPRDRALFNVPAKLNVGFWEKTQSGVPGKLGETQSGVPGKLGETLLSIQIDPNRITLPGPTDILP